MMSNFVIGEDIINSVGLQDQILEEYFKLMDCGGINAHSESLLTGAIQSRTINLKFIFGWSKETIDEKFQSFKEDILSTDLESLRTLYDIS